MGLWKKRFALSLVLPLVQRTAQSRGGNQQLLSQKKWCHLLTSPAPFLESQGRVLISRL